MPNDNPADGQLPAGPESAQKPPLTGVAALYQSESDPTPSGGQDAPVGLPVADTLPAPAMAGTLNAPSEAKAAWFQAYHPRLRDFLSGLDQLT